MLTYLERRSNMIHTFTELLQYQTVVNTFLRVSMYNWTDRKFSKRKFPSKSVKSYDAHIKQIILPRTILELTWLVIDGFMEENGLALLYQKWI